LIAEDEAIFALELRAGLEAAGYRVCGTAGSGDRAVTLAREMSPDCVVLDLGLSGAISGAEVARRIRDRSTVPILFVSGYDDEYVHSQVGRVPNSRILIKPFPVSLACEAVSELTGRR
jgi:DNA-binding NarL/FixJ family response regulator